MSASRGLVVFFADGRIERAICPIVETGPDASDCVEIDGLQYPLYRYTLFTVRGTEYAYFAARVPPTPAQRQQAAVMLFGSNAFGIERLERVIRPGRTQ
jgi:hypothetical protein